MRNYCKNTKVCRHKCLMSEFSDKDVVSPRILHRCCDLCAQVCECDECSRMDETVDATQTDVLEYQATATTSHPERAYCEIGRPSENLTSKVYHCNTSCR